MRAAFRRPRATPAGGAAAALPRGVVLPIAACVLLISALAHVRVPLLPAMGRDLLMSPTELGVAVTLFGVGRLAMDLPAGGLADRHRPMRLMGVAALVMAAGSGLLAAAGSQGVVLAGFLLLGAASATANTTGMTALTAAAPPQRRGAAMALYSGCLLAGQALGPALSGGVAGIAGWRVAAATGAAMGLVVAAVGLLWRRRLLPPERGGGGRGRPSSGRPLTGLQLGALYAVGFTVFLTIGAMPQTLVPLIGGLELGLGVSVIGLAIGLGGLARVLSAVVVGAVSDRMSRRAALVPCLGLNVVGVSMLAFDGGIALWLAAIVMLSLGASAYAVGATVLADRATPSRLGRSLGRYRFYGDLGLVVGPAVAAALYQHAGRATAVTAIAAILLVGAVAALAVIPETSPRRPPAREAA